MCVGGVCDMGECVCPSPPRKDPGGVFLSLVKKTASKEQLQEIFREERQRSTYRKKRAKVRRSQMTRDGKTKCPNGDTPTDAMQQDSGLPEGEEENSPVEDMEVETTEVYGISLSN